MVTIRLTDALVAGGARCHHVVHAPPRHLPAPGVVHAIGHTHAVPGVAVLGGPGIGDAELALVLVTHQHPPVHRLLCPAGTHAHSMRAQARWAYGCATRWRPRTG